MRNAMNVENNLMPTEAQIKCIMEGEKDKPIHMVNLLKFRDKAEYEDGRETDMTGRQAYAIYSAEVKGHIERVGGEVLFEGEVNGLMVGKVEDLWDMIAIVRYPKMKAMMKMTSDPSYEESAIHRIAGLEGQLNIETKAF